MLDGSDKGRRVNSAAGAGTFHLTWDGRDVSGGPARSGRYVLRVATDHAVSSLTRTTYTLRGSERPSSPVPFHVATERRHGRHRRSVHDDRRDVIARIGED